MKLRLSSLGPVALLASSMMLAFSANAASNDEGIVVYNAQHENLVKSWVDGFTKDTGIKVTLRSIHAGLMVDLTIMGQAHIFVK